MFTVRFFSEKTPNDVIRGYRTWKGMLYRFSKWIGVAGVISGLVAAFFCGVYYEGRQLEFIEKQGEPIDVFADKSPLEMAIYSVGLTRSTALELDDIQRWKMSNQLREAQGYPEKQCRMIVQSKPGSNETIWQEVVPILKAAGWVISGGGGQRTYYPDGYTIYVAGDEGIFYNCAHRYKELLESLKVQRVSVKANESTPGLKECNDQCIHVVMGDTEVYRPLSK